MKKTLLALFFLLSYNFIISQSTTFTGIELKSVTHSDFGKVFVNFKIFELNSKVLDSYVKRSGFHTVLNLRLGAENNWEMDLFENDLLSPNYKLRVATENGIEEYSKHEIITYEGYLRNRPDSHIRLTIKDDFIYGFVRQGEKEIFIEPANRFSKSSASNHYVIYKSTDVKKNSDTKCGVTDLQHSAQAYASKSQQESKLLACKRLQLAIASDYSYMIARGGDVGDATAAAIAVMNNVEGDYTGSFNDNIEFEIVEQYVSACSECDPWTSSTDAGSLLSDFRSWGNDGGFTSGTSHDLGQFWTARNICSSGCSTVGLAYLGTVCGTSRYHLLEDYTAEASSLRVLTSHEIGHNFKMIHDNTTGFIMSPSINNTITWSSASINAFNSFVSGISCLDGCSSPSCNPITDLVIQELTGGSPQLQLSWTSSGASNYRIRVRDEGGSTDIFSTTTSSTSLSIDPNMEMCKMYEVIVESFCGGSNYSSPIVGLIENQTVDEPNDIIETNCSTPTMISLTSTLTSLDTYEVLGWWITEDQPISNSITNANKNTLLSNADVGGTMSNPVDHIYEDGNPISQPFSLTFDCSSLDDSKNYFATPFVSNKKPDIDDVSCNVNASIFVSQFNGYPARWGIIDSNQICRPASPPNLPNYSYSLTVSGYSGNTADHYACIFGDSGNDCFIQLSGNGSYTIPSSANIPDPGVGGVYFWVWEEGGSGMSGASITVSLNITYPGCDEILFPDITNIDICFIGDPIQINCSCPPPCSITGVSAGAVSCDGQEAIFDLSFSVVDGSGSYEVVNESNTVVGSGYSSPIAVTVSGPTTEGSQNFRVRDANDNSCISSTVSVSIPICILPCNAASPAVVNGSISSDTMRTKTYLMSAADVFSGNVKFQARDSVILGNNFEVNTNGVFEVQIGDCDDNP